MGERSGKSSVSWLELAAAMSRSHPAVASIQRSPKVDLMAIGNGTVLFVEFKAARRKVEGQLKQLAHIEEMVVSDPEIMRGTPVFKGRGFPWTWLPTCSPRVQRRKKSLRAIQP